MDYDGLSLDQLRVFVAVVETGSFSAAARTLNRAQSAVTYAIQKLEGQIGTEVFDRSAYRPTISREGRVLLPQARRIVEDVGRFRAIGRSMAQGLEAEVRLLVGVGIPATLIAPALSAFRDNFPTVQLRLTTLPFSMAFGRAFPGVLPGEADIRILPDFLLPQDVVRRTIVEVELVAVVAATHPLAAIHAPLDEDALRDHVQIVLSEQAEARVGDDRRVVALRIWRVTDPAVQHGLIRAGIGWGSLPLPLVAEDLAGGRLVGLDFAEEMSARRETRFAIAAVHRQDEPLGPAGRWLFERLGERHD
ncbi:LysR family transcriptional regulator [Ancylobacter sp. WKF20]|uniref:LysR family transcriptional regulator n=1 Tax=Ancylobacter sp. WKF20 TaxID=3039801 RepID=UPI0024340FD4|nr:LysR family transcriptional regulator [Ancylobacter sp. WKF20]WGD29650.1 LysR family transcriptional regulator [Ancylobacter sp. WKF20]